MLLLGCVLVEWSAVGAATWLGLLPTGGSVNLYDPGVWEEPARGSVQDHKQPQQAVDLRTGSATVQDRGHQELELVEYL